MLRSNQPTTKELITALFSNNYLKLLVRYLVFKEMYDLVKNPNKLQEATRKLGYVKTADLTKLSLDDALEQNYFDITMEGWSQPTQSEVQVSNDGVIIKPEFVSYFHKSLLEDNRYDQCFNIIQKIVLKTLNWAPFATIQGLFNKYPFDTEDDLAIQEDRSHIMFMYKLVENDFVTDVTGDNSISTVFLDKISVNFQSDFCTYLHEEIDHMQQVLKTKGLLTLSEQPSKTAHEILALSTELLNLIKDMEEKELNNVERIALDFLRTKIMEEQQNLNSLKNLLAAIRFLSLINTKSANDLDHADCLELLRTITDKALRHEMLSVLFARFYNTGQETLYSASEDLCESLKESTALNGFGLKDAACNVLFEVDDLFLDPKKPVPHDKLINALTVTKDIIKQPNLGNILKLGALTADIGKYPKGKILSRSLIIVGGLGLIAVGIGIAMGCPPLGMVAAALGGMLIASCSIGGAGLMLSFLGIYAVKRAAHKESAAIDATIVAAKRIQA